MSILCVWHHWCLIKRRTFPHTTSNLWEHMSRWDVLITLIGIVRISIEAFIKSNKFSSNTHPLNYHSAGPHSRRRSAPDFDGSFGRRHDTVSKYAVQRSSLKWLEIVMEDEVCYEQFQLVSDEPASGTVDCQLVNTMLRLLIVSTGGIVVIGQIERVQMYQREQHTYHECRP